jgi:hypothetical protein
MILGPLRLRYRAFVGCRTRIATSFHSGNTNAHSGRNRLGRLNDYNRTSSAVDLANTCAYAGNNSIFLSADILAHICTNLRAIQSTDHLDSNRTHFAISMASCLRNADVISDQETTSEFLRLLALQLSACTEPLTLREIRRLLRSTRALRTATPNARSVVREITRLIGITHRNRPHDHSGMKLAALDAARLLYPLHHLGGHLAIEEDDDLEDDEREMKIATRELLHAMNTLIQSRLRGPFTPTLIAYSLAGLKGSSALKEVCDTLRILKPSIARLKRKQSTFTSREIAMALSAFASMSPDDEISYSEANRSQLSSNEPSVVEATLLEVLNVIRLSEEESFDLRYIGNALMSISSVSTARPVCAEVVRAAYAWMKGINNGNRSTNSSRSRSSTSSDAKGITARIPASKQSMYFDSSVLSADRSVGRFPYKSFCAALSSMNSLSIDACPELNGLLISLCKSWRAADLKGSESTDPPNPRDIVLSTLLAISGMRQLDGLYEGVQASLHILDSQLSSAIRSLDPMQLMEACADVTLIARAFCGLQKVNSECFEGMTLLRTFIKLIAASIQANADEVPPGIVIALLLSGLTGKSIESPRDNAIEAILELIVSWLKRSDSSGEAFSMTVDEIITSFGGLDFIGTDSSPSCRELVNILTNNLVARQRSGDCLNITAIAVIMGYLHHKSSDCIEMRRLISFLTEQLKQQDEHLSYDGFAEAMFGMQQMNNDVEEVNEFLDVLADKLFAKEDVPLSSANAARIIFGFKSMTVVTPPVSRLLVFIAHRLVERKDLIMTQNEMKQAMEGINSLQTVSPCDDVNTLISGIASRYWIEKKAMHDASVLGEELASLEDDNNKKRSNNNNALLLGKENEDRESTGLSSSKTHE